MVVGGLQRDRLIIKRARTAIIDGVESELFKGVLVPINHTAAGRYYIFDKHDDRRRKS